jgi:hypothetical protein
MQEQSQVLEDRREMAGSVEQRIGIIPWAGRLFAEIRFIRLGVCSAAFCALACGGPDSNRALVWGGTMDTLASGRVVVRSPDVGLWQDEFAFRERLRLGTLEGEGPELFGDVSALELGRAGEVYVLDGLAHEVRVFGSDGSFQRAFGREGEGPGELRSPAGLALDSEGTLWLMNWGNGRYTGFDPVTGNLRREVVRRVSSVIFPWPGAFQDGQQLLDVGVSRHGQLSAIRLDSAFVPKDTLTLPQPATEDRIVFRRGSVVFAALVEPFAPQPEWAPRPPGGIVVGEGSEYRVHRIGFDGDTSMTMELERERARTTTAERDSALAFFQELEQSLQGAVADRQPRPRSTKPAHGPLFVDDQDRTWVRAVSTWGADPEWDVFAADGRFLGQVGVPGTPGFLRPVIRGNRMLVTTEEKGFPEVIVYDLVGAAR